MKPIPTVIRTLKTRLFVTILGTVLLGVGLSLVLGIALTRDAIRDSIAKDLAHEADVLTERLSAASSLLPPEDRPLLFTPGTRIEIKPFQRPPGQEQGPPPERSRPRFITLTQAEQILSKEAAAALSKNRPANGEIEIGGESQLFSARTFNGGVLLLTRPAALGSSGYGRYLTALLLASALAALLAAATAAPLARRLTAPLKRVSDAARALAAGRSPTPLPPERTTELATLSQTFNEMAEQLSHAREAERAVLLSVSHELRTPLTAIRGYAEGIEDQTVEANDAAGVIGREAGRLERLVQDLLALARLEQGVLTVRSEPVDLASVAQEVEKRLLPQAREGEVAIQLETATTDTVVTADYDRSVQVLSNLVENAIRITPEGGTVLVRVGDGQIQVKDTGPGIAPEDLPHAFERFHLHRSQGSPDGSGLGLAIVKELTEAMGGEVSAHSELGKGAQFTVSLPKKAGFLANKK